MAETSASILSWGDETFGKVSDPVKLVERVELELAELKRPSSPGMNPKPRKRPPMW